MISKLFYLVKKKALLKLIEDKEEQRKVDAEKQSRTIINHISHDQALRLTHDKLLEMINSMVFQKTPKDYQATTKGGERIALDSSIQETKAMFGISNSFVNPVQLAYFANHSYIGYQVCAILAQHWLIDKACSMPAEDAIRNGYEITINDGTKIDPSVREEIRKWDKKYRINKNLFEFIKFGRVFGIRIAWPKVKSNDPTYYENPYNPDGVAPGSYEGIAQIDPYWITPELDLDDQGNPASIHFYEPTYWRVNGQRIHRSHLIIFRNSEPADILKPTYIYGGIPVPQRIFNRVYSAERVADEAPQLAQTKRTAVQKVDVTKVMTNPTAFEERMNKKVYFQNNYATQVIGLDEEAQQFDTSLADLDAVIMTQYQIVAAAANVPATKLLGTTPKGFNATGEYDDKSYHEELESIQAHDLTPLLERHLELLIRSEIAPKFNIPPFEVDIKWNSTNSMSAKEEADLNKAKAETGATLISSGAISPDDERNRIIADPKSGYSGVAELDDTDEEVFTESEEDE